jgi:hypothetical protein
MSGVMRRSIPFLLLLAVMPASAMAAVLEYSCRLEKSFGPISSSTSSAAPADERNKDKAPERFVYDLASGQATATDAHGQPAPALAMRFGGGIRFIASNVVTTIGDSGEFHRVATVTVNGKVTSTVGVGRCVVKENRLAGKPFSER